MQVEGSPARKLVFFRPEAWSNRFGVDFFTVSSPGMTLGREFDQFVLDVQFGDASVTVQRRYSEFEELRKLLPPTKTPFPPKGWWYIDRNERFLEVRQKALMAWLYEVLEREESARSIAVISFLNLPVDEATAP